MTGKPHEGSLGAKMLHIKVGETIWLEGTSDAEIHARAGRAPYLAGRTFSTARMDLIENRRLLDVVAITRVK